MTRAPSTSATKPRSAAFDDIETRHGPISVLVSAAGLLLFQDNGERPLIKDTTLDIWERSFAVNARGVFLCGREFLRRREAAPVPHGRVVTFSSVAAQLGGYRSSASYIAAKSAVLGPDQARIRAPGHHRQRHRPGPDRHRHAAQLVTSSGALAAAARRPSRWAASAPCRTWPPPSASWLGRRRLHHGQHHRCQRRLPHAVPSNTRRSTQSNLAACPPSTRLPRPAPVPVRFAPCPPHRAASGVDGPDGKNDQQRETTMKTSSRFYITGSIIDATVATACSNTRPFHAVVWQARPVPGQYPDQRQSRSASRHARRTGQHPAWTVLTAKMISNGRQP